MRISALVVALFLTHSGAVYGSSTEEADISNLLHGLFDKPSAPLNVPVIVIAGNHAIADWTQGEMGGRALLRKRAEGWALILCAGDTIKTENALVQAGIAAADATALARDLATAEARLPADQVAAFSRFEGSVMMNEHAKSH